MWSIRIIRPEVMCKPNSVYVMHVMKVEEVISFLNESDYQKIIRKNELIYKEKYKNNPLHIQEGSNDFGESNYMKWARFVITTKESILGMNASSISEVTGIPRATVIRKLRITEKKGLLHKDKQQLYTIGKNYKSKLKDLERVFTENQIDLCKFISTFFEIYRNKSR